MGRPRRRCKPESRKGLRGVPIKGTLRDYLGAQKAHSGRDGRDLVLGPTATKPFVPTTVWRRTQAAWTKVNKERAKQKLT
jgi:hypothetical protein